MFGNILDEGEGLKRETNWLDKSLFKSLIILVGILFGPTVLQLFREDMILETSSQSVGEKTESIFVGGRNKRTVLWISNKGLDI